MLTPSDTIISTLGRFRLSVRPNNCSLYIEKFDIYTNRYIPYQNCYSKYYKGGSCNYLTIRNGTIYTDNDSVYSKLSNDNYLETALTLDDNGVVRLQGIPDRKNRPRDPPNAVTVYLQNNRTTDNFIEPHTSLAPQTITNYQNINNNGWRFNI